MKQTYSLQRDGIEFGKVFRTNTGHVTVRPGRLTTETDRHLFRCFEAIVQEKPSIDPDALQDAVVSLAVPSHVLGSFLGSALDEHIAKVLKVTPQMVLRKRMILAQKGRLRYPCELFGGGVA